MKRESFRSIIASIAVMLLLVLGGCQMDSILEQLGVDNPKDGIMSKETADKIFYYSDDGSGGVRITGVKSGNELKVYLATTTRVAATRSTLIIKSIDGKPVTQIGPGAFALVPSRDIPDITLIIDIIRLPETIEELGANLFQGAEYEVFVLIPSAAINNIVEKYIEAARDAHDEAAASAAEANPGVVFVDVVAESAAGIKPEPSVEGENTIPIATGPMPPSVVPTVPSEEGAEGEDGKSGEDGVTGEDGNSGGDGVKGEDDKPGEGGANGEPDYPVPPDGSTEGEGNKPGEDGDKGTDDKPGEGDPGLDPGSPGDNGGNPSTPEPVRDGY